MAGAQWRGTIIDRLFEIQVSTFGHLFHPTVAADRPLLGKAFEQKASIDGSGASPREVALLN